jgi:phosphoglycolate phosphatase-like HAD superfamily hydrolase
MAIKWFDFDGTIVHVKERFYNVHMSLCEHFKIKPLPENDYWEARCNGVSTKEILKSINAENVYEEYISRRNDLIESEKFLRYDTLREGVEETLKEIKSKDKVFVLSGRLSKDMLVKQIDWLGLSKYVDEILVVSPFGGWEDKCEVLKKYASPSDLFVGDNPKDILAGKNAHIKTVAILNGMSTKPILESVSPDSIIDKLSALLAI